MKFCSQCGNQLVDEAVVCPNCGCAATKTEKSSGLQTAAKIFMIIGTVAFGWSLIPLCWCIPMTVSYFNKTKQGIPVSTGFKVCTLLFVNIIAGILMLCDD